MNRKRRRKLNRLAKKAAKLVATPKAFDLAAKHGIEISDITPTGSKGQVITKDVRKYLKALQA